MNPRIRETITGTDPNTTTLEPREKIQMSETQNCGIEMQEPQHFALAEPEPDPEPDLEPDLDPGRKK